MGGGVDDTEIGECAASYKPARMGYGPPRCREEDDEGQALERESACCLQ